MKVSTVYLRGKEEVYTGRPALPASSDSLWTKPLVSRLRVETGRWTLGKLSPEASHTTCPQDAERTQYRSAAPHLEFLRSVTKRGAQVAPLLQL